jgi:hypothetical protein
MGDGVGHLISAHSIMGRDEKLSSTFTKAVDFLYTSFFLSLYDLKY